MAKDILSNTGINFNELEEEIYKMGCEFAVHIMEQVLNQMDEQLMNERDKEKYRNKGIKTTTLKTLMGEVEYRRRIYESRDETGAKEYTYLLDAALDLDNYGLVSSNLASMIVNSVSVCSFRETSKKISKMTGQTISHGGAWNIVQEFGERISKQDKKNEELLSRGCFKGDIEIPVLFEEADGVWINMQGKDRPPKGRKREMKMAVAYDGWKKEGLNKYSLSNKILISGFEDVGAFRKKKEAAIASVFNIDEIEMRIVNGDGADWIQKGIVDMDSHYQLDPFHRNREITRKVSDKEDRRKIRKLLSEKRLDEMLEFIWEAAENAKDERNEKNLKKLYVYFYNNKEGLTPYQERGIKLPEPPTGLVYRNLGTMEHHVCDSAAKRMKHQKASWSKRGALNMARILNIKICGDLHQRVTGLSKTVLPAHYTEVIEEVLSAAKVPAKEGKGYNYPVVGSAPLANTFMTNGRRAILGLLKGGA